MNGTKDPIVIEHLSKNYGDQVALKDLNLTIASGVCVGYLGPNGAGKTTTIKILTDLLRATSGRAYLLPVVKRNRALTLLQLHVFGEFQENSVVVA
jgi:ABC-type multidrug transport system ATPase subunit